MEDPNDESTMAQKCCVQDKRQFKRSAKLITVACCLGGTMISICLMFHSKTRSNLVRNLLIAGYEENVSWLSGESLETKLGTVPSITCPIGKYRPTSVLDSNYQRIVGVRSHGCRECPRGRYGETTGLTSDSCSAECPLGRYRDITGGKSVHDCIACPPGKYGSRMGLTTRACSGDCPDGKYSNTWALTTFTDCKVCPEGYRGWQCTWEIVAQHSAGIRRHHHSLDVRPATKLRSSPVRYKVGPNHPKPIDLSIPFELPLVNERATGHNA